MRRRNVILIIMLALVVVLGIGLVSGVAYPYVFETRADRLTRRLNRAQERLKAHNDYWSKRNQGFEGRFDSDRNKGRALMNQIVELRREINKEVGQMSTKERAEYNRKWRRR